MACINSKGPKKRIDRILAQMHEMAEKGDSNVRPDRVSDMVPDFLFILVVAEERALIENIFT